eukprot:3937790-Rhodomonas_salina.2
MVCEMEVETGWVHADEVRNTHSEITFVDLAQAYTSQREPAAKCGEARQDVHTVPKHSCPGKTKGYVHDDGAVLSMTSRCREPLPSNHNLPSQSNAQSSPHSR